VYRVALIDSHGTVIAWVGLAYKFEQDANLVAFKANEAIPCEPFAPRFGAVRIETLPQKSLRRRDVYQALGIVGETIPPDLSRTFYNVRIEAKGVWANGYGSWMGTVTVKPADGSYAKHRVFLHCACGKLVPFGRIAQHQCKGLG
jgi:hypothetical protein